MDQGLPPGDPPASNDIDNSGDDAETRTLRARLVDIRTEHQDLDDAIEALAAKTLPDQIQIARLKKKKLLLKDIIVRIEDLLMPDIIA